MDQSSLHSQCSSFQGFPAVRFRFPRFRAFRLSVRSLVGIESDGLLFDIENEVFDVLISLMWMKVFCLESVILLYFYSGEAAFPERCGI